MIKNWIVTTEAVKDSADGVIARERYLTSQSHPNHQRTEQIVSLVGNEQTSQRIALRGEQFRLNQRLNKKGGRPLCSYAMEFCLTLPKGYRPTPEQWQNVVKDCCISLVRLCQLSPEEIQHFRTGVRAVLHQQTQQGTRGSGDHVHLIISKIVKGRVLKELQKKKATAILKHALNEAMLKHVGINYEDYEPRTTSQSKRLESWQYKQEQNEHNLAIEKLIVKMQRQADKWFDAYNHANQKQMERQRRRLIKTFAEISDVDTQGRYQSKIAAIKVQIGIHL